MTQSSLWQDNKTQSHFAEICNALYERELRILANTDFTNAQSVQGRLKSLPHYINKTARLMTQVNEQGLSPLVLDVQNATWSVKQASKLPLTGESDDAIYSWYLKLLTQQGKSLLGLVVPILFNDHIILDCIDGVDLDSKRVRTNTSGWFELTALTNASQNTQCKKLLKPTKKVMSAATAGHRWQDCHSNTKLRPVIPTLRELLLSCAINWKNFQKTLN